MALNKFSFTITIAFFQMSCTCENEQVADSEQGFQNIYSRQKLIFLSDKVPTCSGRGIGGMFLVGRSFAQR